MRENHLSIEVLVPFLLVICLPLVLTGCLDDNTQTRSLIYGLEQENQRLKAELQQLNEKIEKLETENKSLKRQIENLTLKLHEMTTLKAENEALRTENNTLKNRMEELEQIKEELENRVQKLEQQIEEEETTVPITPTGGPAPYRTAPPSHGWTYVIRFSGSASKTTSLFNISSNRWRITWECETQIPEFTVFSFDVYRQGASLPTTFMGFLDCPGRDTTYIYEGSGTYYIRVNAANVDRWTLVIEQEI